VKADSGQAFGELPVDPRARESTERVVPLRLSAWAFVELLAQVVIKNGLYNIV
jgi:hypothetical protein